MIATAQCLPQVVKSEQLGQLQQEALSYLTCRLPDTLKSESAPDKYWHGISKLTDPGNPSSPRFTLLPRLAQAVLVIPHGNADSERLFSQMGLNKTKLRNRLGLKTLNALLCIKYNSPGNCFDFKPSEVLMRRCKNAVKSAKELLNFDQDGSEGESD